MVSPALSDEFGDFMNNSARFAGMTPENLKEKIRGYTAAADQTADGEKRAKRYAYLVTYIGCRVGDVKSQDLVLDLAEKALSLNPVPFDRMEIYSTMETAMRKKYSMLRGEDLSRVRRDMGLALFRGLEAGLENIKRFEEENPDFDPDSPPDSVTIDPFMMNPPPSKAYQDWAEVRQEYRVTEQARMFVGGLKNRIADLYAREPYEVDKMEKMAFDILKDQELVNELSENTTKQMMFYLKMSGGDITDSAFEDLEPELVFANAKPTLETDSKPERPATPTQPKKSVEAAENALRLSDSTGGSNTRIVILVGVVVSALAGFVVVGKIRR